MALSALVVFREATKGCGGSWALGDSLDVAVERGLGYLARTQQPDGGWGDTERSKSNIATTFLTKAAIVLAKGEAAPAHQLSKTDQFLDSHGGVAGLRNRYGADQTFVAPILTNCALAGLVEWNSVPQLPFELAAFPHELYRFLQMPVVSYAIPALVAVGVVRHIRGPRRGGLLRWVRDAVIDRCLSVVDRMQPKSGGFLEAIPLTAFVTMGLSAAGFVSHPVVGKAVAFLLRTQRDDGSWPVDVDLSTWLTSLSINALSRIVPEESPSLVSTGWLLGCQWLTRHPFTNAAPGGWGWTDQPGAVPDADDTSGALLALGRLWTTTNDQQLRSRILPHVVLGLQWLVDLQNQDGGWPTFCRGWGRLPFDRSAVDLTAHAVRAIHTWEMILTRNATDLPPVDEKSLDGFDGEAKTAVRGVLAHLARFGERLSRARSAGIRHLLERQSTDGSWVPLWFGNEFLPGELNPVYGTARCLLAFEELGAENTSYSGPLQRALRWLVEHQNADGSWGRGSWDVCNPPPGEVAGVEQSGSVEETAVAVSALSGWTEMPDVESARVRGLAWLIRAVEEGKVTRAAPIGLYFARLWYYEDLYPLIFVLEALGRALKSPSDWKNV